MVLLLATVVLAATVFAETLCEEPLIPTHRFTNVFDVLVLCVDDLPFVLTLGQAPPGLGFSFGILPSASSLRHVNITIQYLPLRSLCEIDNCVKQTIWITEPFEYVILENTLTLRNVRLSGQKMLWSECEAEWCTHCPSPPFLWPGQINVTTIEQQPVPMEGFDTNNFCLRTDFSFFSVMFALVIENSTLDNVRVRAQNFIEMLFDSSLVIINSAITRMDFSRGFIGSTAGRIKLVKLMSVSITGFNRDHAFVTNYGKDTGFLNFTEIIDLYLVSCLFEDNIQLTGALHIPLPFIAVTKYMRNLMIKDCVFRNSMHSFSFRRLIYSVLILNSTFINDLADRQAYFYFETIGPTIMRVEHTVFANISVRDGELLNATYGDILLISQSKFVNNKLSRLSYTRPCFLAALTFLDVLITDSVFIENENAPSSQPSLITKLISQGLLNDYPQFSSDLQGESNSVVLDFEMWTAVSFRNVTLQENSGYRGAVNLALPFSVLTFTAERLSIVGIPFGLQILESESAFNVSLSECRFENVSHIAIALNYANLLVVNSLCENSGCCISLYGLHLQVQASNFIETKGTRRAIEFTLVSNKAALSATLLLQDSLFFDNSAGDISLFSSDSVSLLTMNIRNSHFSLFKEGSVLLDNPHFQSAAIKNCSFTYGQSIHESVIVTTHVAGLLELEDVILSHNTAINSNVILISTPEAKKESQEKHVKMVRVVIADSVFAVGIMLQGEYWKIQVLTVSCSFIGNRGVVLWSDRGVLEDSGSLFQNNSAEGYPCYFQAMHSGASFQNTQFIANSAHSMPGGCVYIRGFDSTVLFSNCTFRKNSALITSGGCIAISKSALVEITDSLFVGNSAKYGSVLYINDVQLPLIVRNSKCWGNQGSGVIQAFDSSSVLLVNVSIANSPSALLLISSILKAQHCAFSELGTQGNCVLEASAASNVTLEDCLVTQTQCDKEMLKLTSESALTLIHSDFRNLTSALHIVTVRSGNLEISHLQVEGINVQGSFLYLESTRTTATFSQFLYIRGVVFTSLDSTLFSLSNSTFVNVSTMATGSQAELIFCNRVQHVELRYLLAENITAEFVGVQLAGASQCTIAFCVFQTIVSRIHGALLVQAEDFILHSSRFFHNRAIGLDSAGGAISLHASVATISNCNFTSNYAINGGVIFWSSSFPKLLHNVLTDNRALFGPFTASVIHHLTLFNTSTLTVISGQIFTTNLVVGLLDKQNQVVISDSRAIVQLVGTSLSGSTYARAFNGLLLFTNFQITGLPGSTVNLSVLVESAVSLTIPVYLRFCIGGEIWLKDLKTCMVCPILTFSSSPNSTECSKCPSNGSCPGDGRLYPTSGFWRPSESYDGLIQCPNSDSCLGHSDYFSQTGVCAKLYQGNACQSCVAGASRSTSDKCAECPSPIINYALIALTVPTVLLVVGILTKSALRSAQKKAKQTGILLKIFLNYTNVSVLVVSFQIKWPPAVQRFFFLNEYIGNSGEQHMSLDCLISDAFFKKSVAVAVLPVLIVILNVLFWCVILQIGRLLHLNIQIRAKLVCSTIVNLFYFHTYISRIALSAFSCVPLEAGESWLRVEMSIRCWDQRHSLIALAISLPVVVLWGLGIPALALLLLIKYRKRLQEKEAQTMLGFLCGGYQRRFYYWEVVIVYRKLLITTLYVFLGSVGEAYQALTLILILCASFLLQRKYKPFKQAISNRIELMSITVLLLTAYFGLYFSFASLSEWIAVALLVLTLLVNFAFLLLLVVVLVQPTLRRLMLRVIGAWVGYGSIANTNPVRKLNAQKKQLYLAQLQMQAERLA